MYYRITRWTTDPSRRSELFRWIESLPPRLPDLGAHMVHFVELGSGIYAIIGLYTDKDAADAAALRSKGVFDEGVSLGFLNRDSATREEGESLHTIA